MWATRQENTSESSRRVPHFSQVHGSNSSTVRLPVRLVLVCTLGVPTYPGQPTSRRRGEKWGSLCRDELEETKGGAPAEPSFLPNNL